MDPIIIDVERSREPESPAETISTAVDVAFLVQLFSFYLLLDVVLLLLPYLGAEFDVSTRVALLAIPLAQTSMLAVWIGRGRQRAHWRFAVGVPLLVGIWTVLVHRWGWEGQRSLTAACWMISLLIQIGTILTGFLLAHIVDSIRRGRIFQFPLGSVLGWTLAAALCLGVLRYGQSKWGWSRDALGSEALPLLLALGVCHGLYALFAVVGLCWRRVLIGAVTANLAIVGMAAVQYPYMVAWFPQMVGISLTQFLCLAGGQGILLVGSMLFVRHALQLMPSEPARHVPA